MSKFDDFEVRLVALCSYCLSVFCVHEPKWFESDKWLIDWLTDWMNDWLFHSYAAVGAAVPWSFCHLYCHWRRQLWGTGARAPLDFQLVILGITRFTDSDESCARFSVQYQFLAHFCHFFAHSFPQGVILVPKMPEGSPINFNSTRTSDSGKTGS